MNPLPVPGKPDHGAVDPTVDSASPPMHDVRITDGITGESFVQAGTVRGDGHVDGLPRRAVTPRQLAAPPVVFTNRTRELAALDSAVRSDHGSETSGPAIVVLTGLGGVGKTALAVRWVHQHMRRFSHGCLHAEMTAPNGDPVAPEDVLGEFLRALGVPPHEVPDTLAERRGLYRSMTADRAIAVVLDDVRSPAQVRELLPPSPSSCVLLTCRQLLVGLLAMGATRVDVHPMDEDCAIEVLRRYLGAERVEAELDAAHGVARMVGGLPLALAVAAAMTMARSEPELPLAETARSLAAAESRVEVLSTEDENRVKSILDASFRMLPSLAAQAYEALGVHQGKLFRIELLATALGIPVSGARNALNVLVDANLVTRLQDDEYQLHALVHAHARTVTELEPPTAPAPLRQRMLAWYTHTAHAAVRAVMPARRPVVVPDPDDEVILPPQISDVRFAMTWLEANRSQFVAWATVARELRQWRTALHLADALHVVFLLYKDYRVAAEIHQMGLRAAIATRDVDVELEMRDRRARALIRLGQVEHAREEIDHMLDRARGVGDHRWEARALKTLGMLHVSAGRPELAVLPLLDAWEILERLREPRAVGLTFIELSDVLAQIGDLDIAYEYAEQAQQILTGLAPPDHLNAARAAVALGVICVHTGHEDRAARELRHAVAVLTERGSPADLARAHFGLAEMYTSIRDFPAATRHRNTAEALRAPDLTGRSRLGSPAD